MSVASFLELPELGRAPRTWTVYGETPVSAKAALAFLAGPYGAHAHEASGAVQVIQAALRGWMGSFTRMPKEDKPAKTLAQIFHEPRVLFELRAEYSETDTGAVHLELGAVNNSNWYSIGQRLRQAEQFRGLGQSALVALARAADSGLPIMMPMTLAYMATGRKYLMAHLSKYPGWVLDPQPLDRGVIEGLANPHRTRFTGRLARAILALEKAVAEAKDLELPSRKTLTVYPLSVVWETKVDWGSAYRMITDDFGHRHDRRGPATIFALDQMPGPQLKTALERFMVSIARTGPILCAVSALVKELSRGGQDGD